MNKLRYFIFGCLLLAGFLSSGSAAQAQNSDPDDDKRAASSCDTRFLTFPAWYNGLTLKDGDDCNFNITSQNGSRFIWTIVLNVIEILLNLVGYATVFFIIYGGIKCITGAGSPDSQVAARKTIQNAVVGLVISILSVGLVNIVANNLGTDCDTDTINDACQGDSE